MVNRKIDYSMVGRRFGRLTVIDFDHLDVYHRTHWLCECDCGNKKAISKNSLLRGLTTSCGCLKRKRDNLVGKRYGMLTVIAFDHMDTHGNAYWLCECDCGEQVVVLRSHLLSGSTTSCGCYRRKRMSTHGMSTTRLYKTWLDMRRRCTHIHDSSYSRYGGRGVDVCDEWDDFENFYEWAIDSGYEVGLTIDRIDNDRGYSPKNCRWVDITTQANNRSSNHFVTYNNIRHTIAEWARILNVEYHTLHYRIAHDDFRDFEEYYGK